MVERDVVVKLKIQINKTPTSIEIGVFYFKELRTSYVVLRTY